MPDEQEETDRDEDRVLISGRVPQSVRRRLRLHAAKHDQNLQDLLAEALDEYLSRRGS